MEQSLMTTGLAFALYCAAAAMIFRALNDTDEAQTARRQRVAILLAACGLVLHALGLNGDAFAGSVWHFDFRNALSVFLWQCAALVTLLGVHRALHHLGLMVWPLAGLAAILGAWSDTGAVGTVREDWGLRSHIVLSLLAYGLLSLTAVQAALLAWQDAALRKPHDGHPLPQLPPLVTLENQLFELMAIGFFVLSLALGSGLMFIHDLFAQHLVHKTVLSITAWAVFAALLWGRWRFGWRGRKALRGTFIGYGTLLLAYFGSKFVLEILLGKHWN